MHTPTTIEALHKVESNLHAEIETERQTRIKELNAQDFVTKKDLKELELRMELKLHQEISNAKWQVIGTITAMFCAEIILRHFGA